MNSDKQYLVPSGASHFLSLILTVGFFGMSLYDLLSGQSAILRVGNASMEALGVFLLLVYASTVEGCMMIVTKGYLFAYNVDKAICVPIKNGNVKLAVSIGRRLYGPIFDRNCEENFSFNPKSPLMRIFFYVAISMMFFVSLIPPCYHLSNTLHDWSWTSDLIVAWVFIFFDGFLIVNRLFFRASIRRFWAYTLGDAYFRSILNFELACEKDHVQVPFAIESFKYDESKNGCIPGYNKRVPSRGRILLTGVMLIILVVWVLNSRRNKTQEHKAGNIELLAPGTFK